MTLVLSEVVDRGTTARVDVTRMTTMRRRGSRTGPALLREWLAADATRTRTALGHALGVELQSVSRWCSGAARPDALLWELLEAITGIPGVAFLSGRQLREHERRSERVAAIRRERFEARDGRT